MFTLTPGRLLLTGRRLFLHAAALLLFCSFMQKDDFPVPAGIPDMLFYVQRSLNKNTIVYQLNTRGDEIDEKEPVKIFWVNYAGKGDTEPLNYLQRKYAYGLTVNLLDKEKKTFAMNFVSYKKQILYLIRSPKEKKYEVFSYFNNKLVIVKRIYIHIEGGAFWTPKVKYINISVKDPIRNEEYVEKVIP